MKKILLMTISESSKQKVGHLMLLFAQVEWFSANVIFYAQMTPKEYTQINNHPIGTKYLQTLFQLNIDRKLSLLKELGFDVANLKKIQEYRNTIAHGIIFSDNGILTSSKPGKKEKVQLSESELDQNIKSLEEEGGKLTTFLESKGFKLAND